MTQCNAGLCHNEAEASVFTSKQSRITQIDFCEGCREDIQEALDNEGEGCRFCGDPVPQQQGGDKYALSFTSTMHGAQSICGVCRDIVVFTKGPLLYLDPDVRPEARDEW